jgi:hypothetical protein
MCGAGFRMRVVSEKFVEKTQHAFNNLCSENHALYDIALKKMVDSDRPQMTIHYCTCALDAE